MTNEEKFYGLKQKLVSENDSDYGTEVIKRWGSTSYENSKKTFLKMSESEYDIFESISKDIINDLLAAYKNGKDPKSLEAKSAAKLHKKWLSMAIGKYDKEIHLGIVDMYLNDELFKMYYDKHQTGLASMLRDAVYTLLVDEE